MTVYSWYFGDAQEKAKMTVSLPIAYSLPSDSLLKTTSKEKLRENWKREFPDATPATPLISFNSSTLYRDGITKCVCFRSQL